MRGVKLVQPPTPLTVLEPGHRSVFLAGSIDGGAAPRWQDDVIAALADTEIMVLNPRRADWDPEWSAVPRHPELEAQVAWELEGLERAELVAMVFHPGSFAPVSLLELGLHARGGRLLVACPRGYWRKDNVDLVCERYGVPQVGSLPELIAEIRRRLVGGA